MRVLEKPMAGGFWALMSFLLCLALSSTLAVGQNHDPALDPHPLRAPDTSSPRDTLRTFDTNFSASMLAWRAGEPAEVYQRPGYRALEALDFSQLPERGLLAKQVETALQLKEILDRIDLPPDDQIPGDEVVADEETALSSWTIPKTRITIARVDEGPQAGEFLFSAATVAQMEEFYQRAKYLPYKPGALVGIYEDFLHSPGPLVPRSWATALPAWSKTVVLGEALWQWLGFAVVVVAAFLVVRSLLRWGHRWDERHHQAGPLTRFGAPLSVAAGVLVLYGTRVVLLFGLRITGELFTLASFVLWLLIFIGFGWLVFIVMSRVAGLINKARQVKEGSIDSQLVRVFLRLASVVILVVLIVYAANFFGVPLAPVVAGLGVGGLAIALAIRPTLENVIGGLTLFADKPVRVGSYCRFGQDFGTVEQIGLRSTRLRKLDDTVVSIPNADFSQRELVDFGQRRRRLYHTTLALRYETTAEQLRYVIARLREMLLGHPKVSPDMLHVRFDGFGAYSLDVDVFAYIRTVEWLPYRAIREDINLRIIDILKEAGTGFALPSQTAYFSRDAGLDTKRSGQAEARVQEWRSTGQLPFPEFNDDMRTEKEDVLDYPPEGSPDYKPRADLSDTSR